MPNSLGILEYTVAQLNDITSEANTLGAGFPREATENAYDTVTVRATDAGLPLNTGTGTDVDNMVFYVSKTHLGEWVRGDYNDGTRKGDIDVVTPATVV